MPAGVLSGIRVLEFSQIVAAPVAGVNLADFGADVDYGFAEALTTYGIIGVKVWIFKGEVFGDRQEEQEAPAPSKGAARG